MWNHGGTNKVKLQQRNYIGTVSIETIWGLNQLYSRETSPLSLMQLQITNICSVLLEFLYFK